MSKLITEQEVLSLSEIQNAPPIDVPQVQFFTSHDLTPLAYYHFATRQKPVANVLLIHGGGAHSKAGYQHVAHALREKFNISVYLLDLRGHGQSGGNKGDTPSVEHVWQDVQCFVNRMKQREDTPMYLCGHSSGAGLILNYLSWAECELDGYFFIAPEFGYKSNTAKNDIPRRFATIKLWKFIVSSMTGGRWFGNSPAVFFNYPQAALKEDPLIITSISVQMSLSMTPYAPQKQFQSIRKKYGLFVGEQDELYNVEQVAGYHNLSQTGIRLQSVCKVIEDKNHLSILLTVGTDIGEIIYRWQGLK
ncbi:alpha/beta fold hydrolase [Paenibacillus jamilae]|uniref:alpha/beta hydrolase n=1 Tax=Paenibacillus jamilae TaxID=114136 RepID=UPI003D2C2EB1